MLRQIETIQASTALRSGACKELSVVGRKISLGMNGLDQSRLRFDAANIRAELWQASCRHATVMREHADCAGRV